MLRTSGAELASVIKSDPAWKISKGSRSASRRARKSVGKSLKNCVGLVCRNSEGLNMRGSEAEKQGVSVLGCRFREKAEHVPIKKRRFVLRSPSPSPPPPLVITSPSDETADFTKSQNASNKLTAVVSASSDVNLSKIIDKNISICAKTSEKANESCGEVEDFSGISILAAAACSSSLGRECDYAEDGSGFEEYSVQEQACEVSIDTEARSLSKGLLKEDLVNSSEMSTGGTSSCVFTEPVGELASISVTGNSSQTVGTVVTCVKGAFSVGDSSTLSGDVSCNKDGEITGNRKLYSRDERMHWDLNVVMDAWEHPFEFTNTHDDVLSNVSQDAGKIIHDNAENLEGYGLQDKLASTCAEQNSRQDGESREFSSPRLEWTKENHDMGACRNAGKPIRSNGKSLLSNFSNKLDVVNCVVEDSKCMRQGTVKPTVGLDVTSSDHATQPSVSGIANEDEDPSVKIIEMKSDRNLNDRSVMEGLSSTVDASSLEVENLRNVCASDVTCSTVSADVRKHCRASSSPDFQRAITPNLPVFESQETSQGLCDKVDVKIREPREHANVVPSDGKGLLHSSVCVEESSSASKRCELLLALDTKVQNVSNIQDGDLVHDNTTTMNLCKIPPVASKETRDTVRDAASQANLCGGSDSFDKIHPVETLGCTVDFYHHPASGDGADVAGELQEDYDSQYEDGELREPSELAWQEYDAFDREAQQVNHGSENIETCTANLANYHTESEEVEDRKKGRSTNAAVVSTGVCNIDSEDSGKASTFSGDDGAHDEDSKIKLSQPAEDNLKESRSKELVESSKCASDVATGVIDDNAKKDRMSCLADESSVDSKAIETRVESKAIRRSLQSRIEGPVALDVSSREERLHKPESRFEDSGPVRSFKRIQYSFHNQARGRQVDSWDGSSDTYRGFKRHYSPIVREHSKLDDDVVAERDDMGSVGSRVKPGRKFSPDRGATFGRGSSIRYGPLVDSRAGRGRYNGPSSDESFRSSLKYRRPLSRRDRSLSPFGVRGHSNSNLSRGKSPSQSRSRSPIMWHSPRGRPLGGRGGNTFVRNQSRSPSFRSDVRMQRLRSPHHPPSFGADHPIGFRSNPRSHDSPPHSRWNSSRKDDMGHFREFGYKHRPSELERSPGRMRLRGDRASDIVSPRNMKPDGHYRFPEDGGGRGLRYEENYEDRRRNYGFLRPARRSYEDGMTSRLHQDIDDSFPVENRIQGRNPSSFQPRGLRCLDGRIGDLPRRFRGEQHSLMFERDRKFNSNPKQFGVDVMGLPCNSKSDEQYRSSHIGRFNEMDGRGRRYEGYDEGRKHYGPTNLARRSDMEGKEKRMNHNADEDFQDGPDFRGRGTTSYENQVGSISTRLREDQDPVVCVQDGKPDDSMQSVGVPNSDDSDATKGRIPS